MNKNSGYHKKVYDQVTSSNSDSLGVQLGKLCVTKSIPVTDVASFFGVSRQAVYLWFKGKCRPHKNFHEKIERLVEKLSQQ
jgi:hypothetical protein